MTKEVAAPAVGMRRRITITVVALIATLGAAGAGSALTAGPAHALGDPLVDAHVTVLPSPVSTLAQLCLQVRPSPPQCLQTPAAGASSGIVTVSGISDRYSGFYFDGWHFTGAFVIGAQAYVGDVIGGRASVGVRPEDAGKVYPFHIVGSSLGTTLFGTCEGMYVGDLSLNPAPFSLGGDPVVLHLFCSASIGGAPPGDFQLLVALPVATGEFVPGASFQITHYSGAFAGIGV